MRFRSFRGELSLTANHLRFAQESLLKFRGKTGQNLARKLPEWPLILVLIMNDIVADIFKRVARWIGLPAEDVAAISGHSLRVGATQDLLALNIDLASVMQAGRWKSTAMPMRYGELVLAARGGMARAAQAQGRDKIE